MPKKTIKKNTDSNQNDSGKPIDLFADNKIYKLIIENTADYICVISPDGNFLYASPSFSQAGYDVHDLIGVSCFKFFYSEDKIKYKDFFKSISQIKNKSNYENERIFNVNNIIFEFRYISKTKEIRNAEALGNILFDESGSIIGFLVVARDITEHKKADEELKEWADSLDTFTARFDINGFLIFCNAALLRISGVSKDEIYGRYFPDTKLWSHSESDRQKIVRSLNNAKSFLTSRVECSLLSNDGRQVPIIFNCHPVLDDNGNIKYITGEGKTIVEEVKLREELIDANKNLEARVTRRTAEILKINRLLTQEIEERIRITEALSISENRFRDISFSIADVIWELDPKGRFTYCSKSAKNIYGYEPEELIGQTPLLYVDEETARKNGRLYINAIKNKQPIKDIETWITTKSGKRLCILTNGIPVADESGNVIGYRGVDKDITNRKLSEDENKKLAAIPKESPNPILTADADGNITYINPTSEYIIKSLNISTPENFLPKNHKQLIQTSLLDKKSFHQIETKVAGHIFSWTYNPLPDLNLVHIHGQDITEQKYIEKKLMHDALHDALTELPNRIMFHEQIERAIKRLPRKENYLFAVLFMDLARFKIINDSLGHLIGDKVLVEVASRLKKCLRPGDMAARFGGDEFTVFLDDLTDSSDAIRVAKRIQKELGVTYFVEGHEIVPAASIGIAMSTKDYLHPEDLLRDANTAMFRAKAAGIGSYVMFDKEMHVQALKLLQLESDLQKAIERNEFVIYYQPIVSLKDGKLTGFEALLRWNKPGHGIISPENFINFIEESGQIIPLGEWILKESCFQISEWHKKFPEYKHLTISVNLSAKQFARPDLIDFIKESLEQNHLYASSLKLEITESILMKDFKMINSVLLHLRHMNLQLSIDDFGTGYSSLSNLYRLPIQTLKIDKSFVNIIKNNGENSVMAQTIVNLAKSLSMSAIAEGIETAEQYSLLREMKCDYGQGYYFSKPLSKDATEELIRKNPGW